MTGTPTTADAMAVTASMRWEAMWEQQPFNMTLAVGALPLGLFLASFGRRHHKTCSLVVVCAFGAITARARVSRPSSSTTDDSDG